MAIASAVQAIIPVFSGTIHDEQSQLVDARELHAFLGIGKFFSNWIKDRITQYGFIENSDYVVFANSGENSLVSQNGEIKRAAKGRGGDRRSKTYHLTLDMAKELSMVERNEKGRQARRYFIECEKRLRQIAPSEADTIQAKTIGTDGFQCLAAVLDGKVRNLPAPYRKRAKAHLWQQIHKAFSVCSAQDIPASQMDSARNFIGSYSLEGEYMPASKGIDQADLLASMDINLGSIQSNAERLLERWMTVFNPCVSKLNRVAAREFQERLVSTKMAAISLRKDRKELISS